MTIYKNERRGFTLIELLVVMTIIALMATIVIVALSDARRKSRDARRLADIKQLHNAIELYVNDNKTSPSTAQGLAALVPTYMAAIPPEPSGSGSYGYAQVGASGYELGAVLENGGQIPPLTTDYDGNVPNIIGSRNCNENAGLPTEVMYCEYWP